MAVRANATVSAGIGMNASIRENIVALFFWFFLPSVKNV
jgi:hypothetical protein